MSYNLPWRKGQQGGKALNRSQERRGEGADSQLHKRGGLGTCFQGSNMEAGGKNGYRAHPLYLWEGEVAAGVQGLSGAHTEILR